MTSSRAAEDGDGAVTPSVSPSPSAPDVTNDAQASPSPDSPDASPDGSGEEPPDVTDDPSVDPSPTTGFTGHAYNGAVPESPRVDDDYFSDAVFIGDSRTDGFRLYSGLTTADIFATQSISVDNIYTTPAVRTADGNAYTIIEALSWKSYAKVYIMLGINEMGYPVDSYYNLYSKLVDTVKSIQPDAIIYLQAVMPVSAEKSASSSVYNNTNVQAFNERIAQICEEKGVYYIDTYSAVADADGCLPADASTDGIHLTKPYCEQWLEYLRTHTVADNG